MKDSHIEWCDHTFNPWEGCTKVSTGCKNCYAEKRNARFGGGEAPNWGPGAPRRRTSEVNWRQPLKWNDEALKGGTRPRVFCASLADVFDPEVPQEWRADLFDLICETPNLDWLLLTKRPEKIRAQINELIEYKCCLSTTWAKLAGWMVNGDPLRNVWLGTSVENQEAWDKRGEDLTNISAVIHFLSCEPLLGKVAPDLTHIDWVIAGGESGPGARPMHPDWARGLRDQCAAAGVAYLFKQWGEWQPSQQGNFGEWGSKPIPLASVLAELRTKPSPHIFENWAYMGTDSKNDWLFLYKVGKKNSGRLLDGRTWDQFPEVTP